MPRSKLSWFGLTMMAVADRVGGGSLRPGFLPRFAGGSFCFFWDGFLFMCFTPCQR